MKATKKAYGFLAALLVLCLVFTACSTGGTQTANQPAASEAPAPVEAADGRQKVGVMYTEGLPIVDPGDYTFSIFVDDSKEDDNFFLYPLLEEQTGIKVDLQIYPYTIAQEKLSLALNSGDYADCIGGWVMSANDILVYGVNEGVYIPLDSYYDQYCPRITEILDLEGVRKTMTTPDGHIYSIPWVLEAPLVPFQPFINTQWLDNLGLEMPSTTEEFRDVLRAFKTEDANGNGNPGDEIPFTGDPDNLHLGILGGWFGLSIDKEGFTMVGDQLTFGADKEEYRELIRYMASLYAEGLIDPEIFTQDLAQWKSKGSQGIYGVSHCYESGDFLPLALGEEPDYAALPVLSSPTCDTPVYLRDTYGSTVLKNQVVVTDRAENPEIIARWWDNMLEFENSIQSQNGPIGTVLIPEGGGYRKINTETLGEEEHERYQWSNLYTQSLPKYIPHGFRTIEDVAPYREKDYSDEVYAPYLTAQIPTYWISADDATRLADLSTAITEYLRQKRAEWISGQSNVDDDWDNYIQQLEKLKLQEYIDLRLSVLD